MTRKIALTPRKEPKQGRSRQMRKDILEAAVRVLHREGALRFTTPRVAQAAGISVGSLYQYFPNKQAIIFAIHARTVERAWIEVQRILDHRRWSGRQKVLEMVRYFFRTESSEVGEMGPVLRDAEIYFAEQPEYQAVQAQVFGRFVAFLHSELPRRSPSTLEFSAQLLVTVIESVGKAIAARALSPRQVDRWARACAEMVANQIGLE